MGTGIGIDIVGNWLVVAQAARSGSRVQVGPSLALKMATELTPASAPDLGKRLKEELGKAGFVAADTVVALRRQAVVSKSLSIPKCPPEELPAMVMFAAEEEWKDSAGTGTLDYQADQDHESGRTVLAASAKADVVESIQTLCRHADLPLKAVVPRPYASRTACDRSDAFQAHQRVLLIATGGWLGQVVEEAISDQDAIELSLWQGQQLELVRWTPFGERADRLAGEIRRTIAAVLSQQPEGEVDRLMVVGEEVQATAQTLSGSLGRPLETFSPLAGMETNANFSATTAALGAALGAASGIAWPIDFSRPKRPRPPRDRRRPMAILAGSFAALVIAGGYWMLHRARSDREARIDYLTIELGRLNSELTALQPVLQRHKGISEWTSGDVQWLDELEHFATVAPTTDQAFLSSLDLTSAQGDKPGILSVQGRARQPTVVTQSQAEWAAATEKHYHVSPHGVDPVADAADFSWRFSVDLDLLRKKGGKQSPPAISANPARLEPPAGMKRLPLSMALKSAPPTSSTEGRREGASSKDKPPGKRSNPTQAAPASAGDDSSDPVLRYVNKLKGMPEAQREAEIKNAPKFLRARILQKLRETP